MKIKIVSSVLCASLALVGCGGSEPSSELEETDSQALTADEVSEPLVEEEVADDNLGEGVEAAAKIKHTFCVTSGSVDGIYVGDEKYRVYWVGKGKCVTAKKYRKFTYLFGTPTKAIGIYSTSGKWLQSIYLDTWKNFALSKKVGDAKKVRTRVKPPATCGLSDQRTPC